MSHHLKTKSLKYYSISFSNDQAAAMFAASLHDHQGAGTCR
jgi:hypothetical protein